MPERRSSSATTVSGTVRRPAHTGDEAWRWCGPWPTPRSPPVPRGRRWPFAAVPGMVGTRSSGAAMVKPRTSAMVRIPGWTPD